MTLTITPRPVHHLLPFFLVRSVECQLNWGNRAYAVLLLCAAVADTPLRAAMLLADMIVAIASNRIHSIQVSGVLA